MPLGSSYSIANQIVAPTGALWVGGGAENGFFATDTFIAGLPVDDVRTRTVYIFDVSGPLPVLKQSVDLTSFLPLPAGYFFSIRYLRSTWDQQHVMVCLQVSPPRPIPGPPWNPGAVVFMNPTSYAVEGIAKLSTTSGNAGLIGTETQKVMGARDVVDSRDGNIWVIQGNDGNTSRSVETFSIADVLANGPSTPTTSFQKINIDNHCEELTYGAGFIWTVGGNYTQTLTRINPNDGSLTTYTWPGGAPNPFFFGPYFHEVDGGIWCGDTGRNAKIWRFDPSTFPSDPTDQVSMTNGDEVKAGFASDGTHLWVMDGFTSYDTAISHYVLRIWKVDPTPGSASVIDTIIDTGPGGNGAKNEGADATGAFDGRFIYFGRNLTDGTGTTGAESGFAVIDTQTDTLVIPVYSGGDGTGGMAGGYFRGCRSVLWVNPNAVGPVIAADFNTPKVITYGSGAIWLADVGKPFITKIATAPQDHPRVVAKIDLSGFGVTLARDMFYDATSNLVFACTHRSNQLFAIDPTSNAIVGIAALSERVRNVCIDHANGTVYMTGGNFGSSNLHSFLLADMLASYPSSPTISTHSLGIYSEEIVFGGGFIWGTRGFGGPGQGNDVNRIDPTNFTVTTYSGDILSLGILFGCVYDFGSLWVADSSSSPHQLLRFDPSSFPSNPTVIPLPTRANYICSDGTYIWCGGSDPFGGFGHVCRVSTGIGTETVVATPHTNANELTYSLAFDGANIWATVPFGPAGAGLVRFSTGVGTEAFNYRLITGSM